MNSPLMRARLAVMLVGAAEMILRAAYLVRARFRCGADTGTGLFRLLLAGARELSAFRAYLRAVSEADRLPSELAVPPAERTAAGHRGTVGFRRRLPAPARRAGGGLELLRDERVRRLQIRIVRVTFERRLGVSPREEDLAVLSRFASVGGLARSLARAAGYGAAPPRTREARHRMQTVLPTVVRALELYERYLKSRGAGRAGGPGWPGDAGWSSNAGWPGGAGGAGAATGAVSRRLYPQHLLVERSNMSAAKLRREGRAWREALRSREELRSLGRHIDLIAVMSRHGRSRRLMRYLLRSGESQARGRGCATKDCNQG